MQLKYNQTGNINQGMQTGADYSFDYLMEEGKPANIKKNTGNLLENAPIKYQESVSTAKDLYPIFNKASIHQSSIGGK